VNYENPGLNFESKREQINVDLGSDETKLTKKVAGNDKLYKIDRTWTVLGYIGQIGFAVALPITLGAIAGRYIDVRFGTYPKFTLSLLMFGLIISVLGFVRTIQIIIKKLAD
jgi:predicted F0F1-ATPase subunit